jgi:UPF0716 protein FxsA
VIGFLVLLILLVPFIELWVIIEVWQAIGGLPTLALLVGVSVLGAWLVKREGLGVWGRLNDQVRAGRVPAVEVADGALILFAGALLLTPGFITDIVGILLLIPLTRAAIRGFGRRLLAKRVPRTVRVATWGARTGFGRGPGGSAGPGDDIIDVWGEEVVTDRSRSRSTGELDR